MAGLFKNLLNIGAAYVQHVSTVRNALAQPKVEALNTISSYVRGLSDASFVGFKASIAGLAGKETDNALKQDLLWIVANADAMRLGQFENAQANIVSEPGLSFDETLELIDPWFSLPEQECRAHLHAALARMTNDERQQFVVHLHTAVDNSRNNLQNLKNNEANAWGGYIEDRINYQLAKLSTGASDPDYAKKIEQQQEAVRWFEWLAADSAAFKRPGS